MLGDKAQRSSYLVEIPGNVDISTRLCDLLQELRVILKSPCNIEAILHIVREVFTMDVLSKTQNIQEAESKLCFVAVL